MQSELFAVKIFEHFMRFESSRCCIDFDLTTFLLLEKENQIKSKKPTGFTQRLYTCTHIQTHTHTSSSIAHIRIHVALSVHAKSWVTLSQVFCTRTFLCVITASFQKFTPTNAILLLHIFVANKGCGKRLASRK